MTREDIDDIIETICPNDEDFEKPIISPKYLKQELEQLALEQEPILDKIRSEIIENSIEDYEYHGCGTHELIIETSEVLQIIDEYRK